MENKLNYIWGRGRDRCAEINVSGVGNRNRSLKEFNSTIERLSQHTFFRSMLQVNLFINFQSQFQTRQLPSSPPDMDQMFPSSFMRKTISNGGSKWMQWVKRTRVPLPVLQIVKVQSSFLHFQQWPVQFLAGY